MAMWSSSFGAMVSVSVSLAVQQLIGLELLLANCIGNAGDGREYTGKKGRDMMSILMKFPIK